MLLAPLLLAGCGGFNLFGEGEVPEASRKPANAVEYHCEGGKTFYLRNLDANTVWLIAPDREIRLDKQADGRYALGRVQLEMTSERVELSDPPATYSNCKRAG
jgi:hypothetical protein